MKSIIAYLGACLGFFIVVIDTTALTIVLPTIGTKLAISAFQLQLIFDIYLVFFAALLLFGGYLADIFPAQMIFSLGVIIFGSGSLLCGFTTNLYLLITGRSIQGIGAALLLPASMKVITQLFSGSAVKIAIAIWGAISTTAAAIGPIAGAYLLALFGWQSIFLINVPICILAVSLVQSTRYHWVKYTDINFPYIRIFAITICLSIGVILIVFRNNCSYYLLILLLALILFLAIITVIIDKRSEKQIFEIFADKHFASSTICAFLLNCIFYGQFFLLALILPVLFSTTVHWVAIVYTIEALAGIIGSLITAAIIQKFGPLKTAILGFITLGLGILLIVISILLSEKIFIFPAVLLMGAGTDFSMVSLTSYSVEAISHNKRSWSQGVFNAARQFGSAFGIAIIGGLGLAWSPALSTIIALMAAIICILISCIILIRMHSQQTSTVSMVGLTLAEKH